MAQSSSNQMLLFEKPSEFEDLLNNLDKFETEKIVQTIMAYESLWSNDKIYSKIVYSKLEEIGFIEIYSKLLRVCAKKPNTLDSGSSFPGFRIVKIPKRKFHPCLCRFECFLDDSNCVIKRGVDAEKLCALEYYAIEQNSKGKVCNFCFESYFKNIWKHCIETYSNFTNLFDSEYWFHLDNSRLSLEHPFICCNPNCRGEIGELGDTLHIFSLSLLSKKWHFLCNNCFHKSDFGQVTLDSVCKSCGFNMKRPDIDNIMSIICSYKK